MILLSREELRELATTSRTSCVSLCLPTHRSGRESRQDSIRLKNLLNLAEGQLQERGMRSPEARDLLQPARDLLGDDPFWRYQSVGLSLFLSKGFFRHYRLPITFEEQAVINSRFYLKPILPVLSGDGVYYVLVLSQKKVQLFEGSHYSIREVDVKAMPKSLVDALKKEEWEKELQFYTVHQRTAGRGSEQGVMYHGQGTGRDDQKDNLLRFFREIDKGLHEFLRDKKIPLVLAAAEYYLPIYQEANTYNYLLEKIVPGNHGLDNADQLQEQSWKVVEPVITRPRQQAIATYKEWSGTDKTTRDLSTILTAAFQGRLAHLFLLPKKQKWGKFDPQSGQIKAFDRTDPTAEDLFDLAAVQTFLNGGMVYVSEGEGILDDNTPIAATFRY